MAEHGNDRAQGEDGADSGGGEPNTGLGGKCGLSHETLCAVRGPVGGEWVGLGVS